VSKTEYGLIGGLGTLLLLLLALWGATRRQRWRTVRLGVFLERERFDDENPPETPPEPPGAPPGPGGDE